MTLYQYTKFDQTISTMMEATIINLKMNLQVAKSKSKSCAIRIT